MKLGIAEVSVFVDHSILETGCFRSHVKGWEASALLCLLVPKTKIQKLFHCASAFIFVWVHEGHTSISDI
jgi:hypothetical protein